MVLRSDTQFTDSGRMTLTGSWASVIKLPGIFPTAEPRLGKSEIGGLPLRSIADATDPTIKRPSPFLSGW